MSSRIEKQFSNAATTPILITMSFELNDDKIIERIDAAGGTVPQNDIAKAELKTARDAIKSGIGVIAVDSTVRSRAAVAGS